MGRRNAENGIGHTAIKKNKLCFLLIVQLILSIMSFSIIGVFFNNKYLLYILIFAVSWLGSAKIFAMRGGSFFVPVFLPVIIPFLWIGILLDLIKAEKLNSEEKTGRNNRKTDSVNYTVEKLFDAYEYVKENCPTYYSHIYIEKIQSDSSLTYEEKEEAIRIYHKYSN